MKSVQLRTGMVCLLLQGNIVAVYLEESNHYNLIDLGGGYDYRLTYTGKSMAFPFGRCYRFKHVYFTPSGYEHTRYYWFGENQLAVLQLEQVKT